MPTIDMPFINNSETIGVIVNSASNDVTGSVIATVFCIFLFLLAMTMMFRIPVEYSFLLLIPFVFVSATFLGGVFGAILAIGILGFAYIIAKNFLFV